MKFKKLTNLDVIGFIENSTELFRLKKYRSKKVVKEYIGLGLSRVGYYGLVEPGNNTKSIPRSQTVFNDAQDVTILIEGVVVLDKLPVNNGSGNIVYTGYGVLEVNNTVIYDGRAGFTDPTPSTWGQISGTLSDQTDLQNELDNKSNTGHTHTESEITDLDKYSQGEVDSLLADKSDTDHTHTESDITNLDKYSKSETDILLNNKSNINHTHTLSDISDAGDMASKDTVATSDIDNNAVDNTKLADIPSQRLKGRDTAGIGDAEDLTPSQVRSMINVEDGATSDMTDVEIKTAYENNANTNEFSDAEKTKLASLDSSKFLGEYVTLSALQTAHPSPAVGSYANVDAGVNSDVERYVWDNNDSKYVLQLGVSTVLTDAQIKTQYENNANTNAFTDSEKSKLNGIENGATADQSDSEIETAYNNQVDIVSQSEAEVGTSTIVRRWTAQRVKQAIGALSSLLKVSSNDTTSGYLEDKIDSSGTEGVGIIRTIENEGGNEKIQFRLGNHYLGLASTGLYTGGVLSVGTTAGTFNISAGEGFYIDSNTNFADTKSNVQPVTITARNNQSVSNIAIQPVTYILIDKNDNIVQLGSFPTPEQRRDNIFIGVVVHSDNTTVNTVDNLQVTGNDIAAQLGDVMEGLGLFNLNGNRIQPNGANLSMDKTAGKVFKRGGNYTNNKKDPHTITLAAQTPVTFRYRNQDSSEGSNVTVLDPTTYDAGGTTTTVPQLNDATVQKVYMFPEGQVRVQRGQEVFSTLAQAIDRIGAEIFTPEPNIDENGILLCSIAIRKDCTDLSNPNRARIFAASKFGEINSVGSALTTTLQQAFDNSLDPEIVIPTGKALSKQAETDANQVIDEWKAPGGSRSASMKGNGELLTLNLKKANLTATSAPAATNDSSQGYEVGSVWVNVTNDKSYICVDSTATNAVWVITSSPTLGKSATVFEPTATDNVFCFRTDVAIIMQEIYIVQLGSSPSCTVQFKFGSNRDGSGSTNLTSAGIVTSTTTGNTPPLSNASIPANSWIWVEITAVTNSDQISFDFRFKEV